MPNFIANQKDRLDKFLASQITNVSRAKIQKAIKDGLVLVNDRKIIEPDFEIKIGDRVELPEFQKDSLKPFDLDLKIIFENDDLAVVDKPAGLVVHPGAGNLDQTLANVLISKYPNIKNVGDPHRPGIVHRLDEDTSGLLLVAKTQAGFKYLKNLFQSRNIEKEYLALVHGVPVKLHDVINISLERNPKRKKMKVGSGKDAVTEYAVLDVARPFMGEKNADKSASYKDSGQYSLLRVKLHTGRTHQIRVHLSHIGHSIVGDQLYGGFNKKPDQELIGRQFLHAYKLKFKLPDNTNIELVSDLPEHLKKVLNKLRIKHDKNF